MLKLNRLISLRQVSALLLQRLPAMRWHLRLAPGEAATEGGGLLGLGGVQVSDAEKATLDEISSALAV